MQLTSITLRLLTDGRRELRRLGVARLVAELDVDDALAPRSAMLALAALELPADASFTEILDALTEPFVGAGRDEQAPSAARLRRLAIQLRPCAVGTPKPGCPHAGACADCQGVRATTGRLPGRIV